MLTENPVLETVHELHASTGEKASVYHIGTMVENIETLQQHVFNQLPAKTLHVYTHSKALIEQLQALEMEDKTIIPHWVEPVYPEQWLFHLSKKISEKRTEEVADFIPEVLLLKAAPESAQFKKLAIRRLSLSRLYIELSIFFSVLKQVTPDIDNPLLFLCNHFNLQDLIEFSDLKQSQQFISITPISIGISRSTKKNEESNWRIEACNRLELLKQNEQERKKHLLEYWKLALFFRLDRRYQIERNSFPYAQLRSLETFTRRTRLRFKVWMNTFWVQVLPLKQLQAHWNNLQSKQYFNLKLGFLSQSSKEVLFVTTSLSKRSADYFARITGPIFNRMQQTEWPIILLINNDDDHLCKAFEKKLFTSATKNYVMFPMKPNIDVRSISEQLFIRNIDAIRDIDLWAHLEESQQILLQNTFSSLTRLKHLMVLFYYYAREFHFDIVIGLEEDIEVLSMLNILKPILRFDYRTFIIPSCLPEYSECYDCVDIDDLSVSMDFVKEIFSDQALNTKHTHIVGSLEWEVETSNKNTALSKPIEKMLQSSSFVLGVLHQPIFVTMHQQTIYNQITMDFLDIYQRFLEKHPNACILIKPHPRDNIEQLKTYLGPLERIQILPVETPTSLFYNAIDAAISMHSTMVTHTMAHGIPVVSMYQYPDYHRMYDYMKQTGCLATDSHDEALAWLDKMQNDSVFYESVKDKMACLKEQYLSTPASEKIMQLLESNGR